MHKPDKIGVINIEDLDNIIFSEVFEGVNSLRYNVNNILFIIKWSTHEIPSFITNGTVIPAQILDYNDALNLMGTENWYSAPIPPDQN